MGVKFDSSSSKVDIIEPQYEKKRIKPRIKYGVLGTIFGFSLGLVGFILVYNVLENKDEMKGKLHNLIQSYYFLLQYFCMVPFFGPLVVLEYSSGSSRVFL